MKNFVVIGLLSLGLAGCYSPSVWHKDNASQKNYEKDAYDCEKDARQSGDFGTGLSGKVKQQEFYDRCMSTKGWEKRPASKGDCEERFSKKTMKGSKNRCATETLDETR